MSWLRKLLDKTPDWVRRARAIDAANPSSIGRSAGDEIWPMTQEGVLAKFGQPNTRSRCTLRFADGTIWDGFLCEYWREPSADVRQLVRIHYVVRKGKIHIHTVARIEVAAQ